MMGQSMCIKERNQYNFHFGLLETEVLSKSTSHWEHSKALCCHTVGANCDKLLETDDKLRWYNFHFRLLETEFFLSWKGWSFSFGTLFVLVSYLNSSSVPIDCRNDGSWSAVPIESPLAYILHCLWSSVKKCSTNHVQIFLFLKFSLKILCTMSLSLFTLLQASWGSAVTKHGLLQLNFLFVLWWVAIVLVIFSAFLTTVKACIPNKSTGVRHSSISICNFQ